MVYGFFYTDIPVVRVTVSSVVESFGILGYIISLKVIQRSFFMKPYGDCLGALQEQYISAPSRIVVSIYILLEWKSG